MDIPAGADDHFVPRTITQSTRSVTTTMSSLRTSAGHSEVPSATATSISLQPSILSKSQMKFKRWKSISLFGANKRPTRLVVASCISPSGRTLGVVVKNEFSVFTLPKEATDSAALRCIGKLDRSGTFRYGLDRYGLVQSLTKSKGKFEFARAAISDDLYAVGAEGTLMVFSISERGKCLFQYDASRRGEPNWVINKLLFNSSGNILTAVLTNSVLKAEMAQIFDLASLVSPNSTSHPTVTTTSIEGLQSIVEWRTETTVNVDGHAEDYDVPTNDAKMSHDGNKIALCSNHVNGYAVIRILVKDRSWRLWGTEPVTVHERNAENFNLVGLTGIALYCPSRFISNKYSYSWPGTLDECIVISAETRRKRMPFCFRITGNGSSFKLQPQIHYDHAPRHIAVATSQGGDDATVVILRRDGKCRLLPNY